MHCKLFYCMTFLFWTASSMDSGVIQSPRHLVKGKEQKARMQCTPIKEHSYVYWYYKKLGEDLKFLVYFQNTDIMDKTDMIKKIISAECFTNKTCTIEIKSSKLTDSAVYYCASRKGQLISNERLFFGHGTKLSVLEDLKTVTPPKVSLFEPSEAEIADKQKATLVCLARGFFPDHVELSWWVNGKEIRNGVSTDPQAYKESNNITYCLSSRLRVSAPFWHNPRNHFRCQVQFYGLTEEDNWSEDSPKPVTQNISAEAWGRADCGITSASYQQGVLSATILYEILIGKATLYAVLVSTLVVMAMVKRKSS
nr:Tcrb protein [Rattus norvegicus]